MADSETRNQGQTFLYLDNFRGFQDALIPLKKVNFLVGENGTGKTNLMRVVRFLEEIIRGSSGVYSITSRIDPWHEIVSIPEKDNRIGLGLYKLDHHRLISCASFQMITENDNLVLEKGFCFSRPEHLSFLLVADKDRQSWTAKIYDTPLLLQNQNDMRHGNFFELLEQKDHVSKRISKERKMKNGEFSAVIDQLSIELGELGRTKTVNLFGEWSMFLSDVDLKDSPDSFDGILWEYWAEPVRSKPEKIYQGSNTIKQSPDGAHMPYLLRDWLCFHDYNNRIFIDTIIEFGIESSLFTNLKIDDYRGKGSSVDPYSLLIELDENFHLNLYHTGYGVSQILPVLVDILRTEFWAYLQEPEIHLHPRAQAALGQFFFSAARQKPERELFVETHSDFIIDRFRLMQSKSKEKSDAQVLFFERKDGRNIVHAIPIEDSGQYSTDQPETFREFFINETLDTLHM